MENYDIDIKDSENLLDLKHLLGDKVLFIDDEIQNKYSYIEMSGKVLCGIAYYNYGIPPKLRMEDNQKLWIGFGKKLIIFDIYNNNVLLEESLSSIFYELISDSFHNYTCIICELDIYCISLCQIIWRMGFKDIICEYEILKDSIIRIECNDGEEYLFTLNKGEYVVQ